MDLPTVKAEIKDWERSFKASNGREPTIQDIKLQPQIADKYKLYKKLSKAAAQGATQADTSTSTNTNSDPPSTPPRSRTRVSHSQPSLLLSKPRVAQITAPLSTFNPFSPQKGKQREAAVRTTESRSNPFASPVKAKPKASAQPRTLSPDPFPILQLRPPSGPSNTPPRSPPAPTSAISRARKRLRGEPVSPSPNKEKRRRVGPQPTLPFTTLVPDSSDDDDDDNSNVEMDTSFVTDSPVKPLAGGKSFKLLFDESSAPINTGLLNGKAPIGRTKSTTKSGGLFGTVALSNVDEDMEWGMKDNLGEEKSKMPVNDKLFAGSANQSKPMKATSSKVDPSAKKSPPKRTSAKRPLSDTEMVGIGEATSTGLLLPLSPPANMPGDAVKQSLSTKGKGKAKAKSNVRRKKAKISDSDGEADDDELDIPVKVIDRTHARRFKQPTPGAENDLDFDADPILGYIRHVVPQADVPATLDVEQDGGDGTGTFEVDLPEKLRRVLALESAEAKARDSREERVFKGLLYGQRSSHYDPIKGGDIWDAGEDDVRVDEEGVARRDPEEEDDWEGEPVPWEVGEL